MTDIVLVRPGFNRKSDRHWSMTPPLGLGYLASFARKAGLQVKVVDGKLSGHVYSEETVAEILKYSPKVVGISAMTHEFPAARNIASKVKFANGKMICILGGPHANALPKESLEEAIEFDYVFSGEGEILFEDDNFSKLLSSENYKQIPGLYYRLSNNDVIRKTPTSFYGQAKEPSFPAWDLFPPTNQYSIMTTRGCPYKCVFCSHNNSLKVRHRSVDDVIDEIKWLYNNFHPPIIHFEDETFGLNKERTFKLLTWLIDFNQSRKILFKAQTRVDQVSAGMLTLMKQAGFEYIELGVESGDEEVLKRSGKNITLLQATAAIKIAREAGLKVWLKFIIGLPGETRQSIKNSIRFMVKSNPERLSIAVIVAYPGSEIYNWAKTNQNGYKFISTNWGEFDKYLSNSVELTNLSASSMRYYQIRAYFETYFKNGRYADLLKLIFNNKDFLLPMLKSTLVKRH